jgi:branched-chain amino acid transport system permease protein
VRKSLLGNAALVILGLFLALLPLTGYQEGIVVLLCINCVAAMGVSLLTGFTGIFTLGHAAYMALGAYTAAIMTARWGVHWLPSIVAGGVVAVAVAWLIGMPTLRLTGDYYAIASIGLGEAIRLILENWQSFTRGARGFPGIASYASRGVAAALFTVLGIAMFNLIGSRLGRELKASRDDPAAASLMGFNTTASRMKALLISAFYCGISGALLAGYMTFIQPSMFDMMKSTELTAVVVFGGLGSMSGTLLGAAIITLAMELFRNASGIVPYIPSFISPKWTGVLVDFLTNLSQYRMLLYGLLLVGVMVLLPEGMQGLWSFARKIFSWFFPDTGRPDPEKEGLR